jgi:hypothetical protein
MTNTLPCPTPSRAGDNRDRHTNMTSDEVRLDRNSVVKFEVAVVLLDARPIAIAAGRIRPR